MSEKSILFDASRCMGCRGCQVACKQWNDLPAEVTTNRGSYENPPGLSPDTWMKIGFHEKEQGNRLFWMFSREACMHCTEAACVLVCRPHALFHHDLGFVAYDRDLCNGCGYCTEACPFGVPRMQGNTVTGERKMAKCTFCADRVLNGLDPACVQSCPTGALLFGSRARMLERASDRLRDLRRRNPEIYGGACIYGTDLLDGLHVLYLLPRGPGDYGLPERPTISGLIHLRDSILPPVAGALTAVTVAGLGLNALVTRLRTRNSGGEKGSGHDRD